MPPLASRSASGITTGLSCGGMESGFSYESASVLTVLEIVLDVIVLGSGTGSPGVRWIGFPAPPVAGMGVTLNGFCSSPRDGSSLTVDDMVLFVNVLGLGTFSPGAR